MTTTPTPPIPNEPLLDATGGAAAIPAHHRTRRTGGLWTGVPSRKDPRIAFAVLLSLYAITGTLVFGFNRNPLQMGTIIVAGCLLDMALHWVLRGRQLLFPLSAYISCCSLTLLLNYSHDVFVTLFPVLIAIAGKYVITLRGRHAFNPSLLAIVVSLIFAGGVITAAPAYQWGDWWYTSPFMLAAAIILFITKVDRLWLVGSFIFFYLITTALRAYVMRHHIPAEVMFVGSMTTPPFFLFTFFMITDPATSPPARRQQVIVGFFLAAVDLFFHFRYSVFTIFYAAFTVASARFLWGHLQELRRAGVAARLRTAVSRKWLLSVVTVTALAVVGGTTYATVIRPHVVLDDAGFTLERMPPERTGIDIQMSGEVLTQVDSRVRNVAKWVLSVGAAGAAQDIDGDGRQDLVLTSPLGEHRDRIVVERNVGDFRFERVDVPALEHKLAGDPKEVGLTTGPLFLDYDHDGDRDLFLMVAFNTTMLLRNDSTVGHIAFTDVTEEAHAGEYILGASANVLDYDRDGNLDIYLAGILPKHLPGYDTPTRFNIFDLPDAEYDGDRRMLKFMHASWDNATNGGANVMLHGRADGTFERIQGSKLGMPETHYSIAISTGDINQDGFTDMYVASDFGRDDLYINEGGRTFRRVAGRFFGDVGKDTYKGMNSTMADIDRNGALDVYVSNVHQPLQAEGSILFMNQGMHEGSSEHGPRASAEEWPAPKLQDQATGRGVLNEERFGWGADVTDLNNDGWLDLVQANGMVGNKLDRDPKLKEDCPDYWYVNQKLMQSGPEIHTYADKWGDLRGRCIWADEAQRVYLNRGADAKPEFVDVAGITGLDAKTEGRGVVLADFDDDGSQDMVVTAQHEAPYIYRSTPTKSAARNGWVNLELDGGERPDGKALDAELAASAPCSRDAWGSQVWVDMAKGAPQLFEQQAINGFEGQRDARLHVGLGATFGATVDVTVRWCGHERERFSVRPGATQTLTRGAGTPAGKARIT